MSEPEDFRKRVADGVARMAADEGLRDCSREWMRRTHEHGYDYVFSWLGRPIIQLPQDILAVQEIIWRTRPDLIIETGIAHGGSLLFHASMLQLLGSDGRVVAIDVDIREHNRVEIERAPVFDRITMIEGSSVDAAVVESVRDMVAAASSVLVVLDSDHTHAHVLAELQAYAPLVKPGGYVVVCDTAIDRMDADAFPDRAWGPGDNPMTAVDEFLRSDGRFVVDEEMSAKLVLTNAPRGYLKCIG